MYEHPSHPDTPFELRLPIRGVTRRLVLIVLLIGAIGAGAHWAMAHDPTIRGLMGPFDMHARDGLAAWLNTVLAFGAALAVMAVARVERGLDGRFVPLWRLLALILLVVSLSKVLPIAAWIGDAAHRLETWPLPVELDGRQLVVAAMVALAVLYVPLLWHVPGRVSVRLVLGGALLGLSDPALSPLQGHYHDPDTGGLSLAWGLWSVLEETLEMLGIVLLIGAALLHLRDRLHLRFTVRLSRSERRMQILRRSAPKAPKPAPPVPTPLAAG
jgi:hypothetical protein